MGADDKASSSIQPACEQNLSAAGISPEGGSKPDASVQDIVARLLADKSFEATLVQALATIVKGALLGLGAGAPQPGRNDGPSSTPGGGGAQPVGADDKFDQIMKRFDRVEDRLGRLENSLDDNVTKLNRRIGDLEYDNRQGAPLMSPSVYRSSPGQANAGYSSAPSWDEQTWLGPYRRPRI